MITFKLKLTHFFFIVSAIINIYANTRNRNSINSQICNHDYINVINIELFADATYLLFGIYKISRIYAAVPTLLYFHVIKLAVVKGTPK